jgi:hypothetical protein
LSRPDFALKSADAKVKVRADHAAKKVAAPRSAKDTALAAGLTLDDFGGRSDALGG